MSNPSASSKPEGLGKIAVHFLKLGAFATALGACAQSVAEAENASAPLVLEATVPLGDVRGRIDHMAVDLGRRRLLVAELGNGTVDVVDLASRTVVHRIAGLKEPQGVGYVATADLIVVACSGDGSLHFYHAADFAPAGTLDLGDDADNIRVDSGSEHVIVGYGAGALAVVDAASRAKLQDIRLAGHPESFQLDPGSNRAFVNVPDAGQIAAVDLGAGRQIANWTVPGARANFPMAIDVAGATIAVVFRSPARLALLDTKNGVVSANAETCGDGDDVYFDAKRGRIYVSCGDGVVDVFARDGAGLRHLAGIQSGSGARTSLFVPELDRLFVARRQAVFGAPAAILVFRPVP